MRAVGVDLGATHLHVAVLDDDVRVFTTTDITAVVDACDTNGYDDAGLNIFQQAWADCMGAMFQPASKFSPCKNFCFSQPRLH